MTEVKICGMMRPEDVTAAADADYVGFVLKSRSRRCLTTMMASELMSSALPKKVVVTASDDVRTVIALANSLRPDVVQAHSMYSNEDMERLRSSIGCELWLLLPVGDKIPMLKVSELRKYADRVVLDTPSPQGGGVGKSHDWEKSAAIVQFLRPTRTILAGGLDPENVGRAISTVRPDVVDVSSGVELEGTKSPELIREFISKARNE